MTGGAELIVKHGKTLPLPKVAMDDQKQEIYVD